MRVVIELDGTSHETEISQAAPTATLADLVERVCGTLLPADEAVYVDEHAYTAGDKLADVTLLEGSRVRRTPLERATLIPGWAAVVSGGLDAGRVVPVPTGRPLAVGRSPLADITVDTPSASWSHLTVTHEAEGVRVRDAGSTNGTYLDGAKVEEDGVLVTHEAVVLAGGVSIVLRDQLAETVAPPPGSLHNLTPAGTAPFNRPPRPGRPSDPDAVVAPVKKDPPAPPKFPLATVIGPLILAFVMVLVIGNAMYAIIGGLSPILGLGTFYEQKRRRRKDIEEEDRRFAAAVETFDGDIAGAAAEQRTQRREEMPDPATTIRRAALPTTLLWQRRDRAEDFLRLHAGIGAVPWEPPLDSTNGNRLDDDLKTLVKSTVMGSAPVEADLGRAGVIGIVGDREGALALARSLVAQAAVHSGPADLTIGVFCDGGRDDVWGWTTWLPHVRLLGDSSGGQWVSADRTRSESLLRSLRDGIEGHPTPAVLLVLDSDVLTEGRNAPARTLLGHGRPLDGTHHRPGQREVQVSGIVIASSAEALPASCTTVVEVRSDAQATVTRPGDLTTIEDVVLAGLSQETARACALDLARFDDPELVVPGAALPSLVRLPPLLGFDDISAAAIKESWAAGKRIATPVGIGESGGFELDLVRDGPHGLVGGTTGSGKSEFLRSMVAGLAMRADPTRLTFILIDFKGGAAFASCERLPHTIGTVSNLDAQLADRALRALEAEMDYRQRAFAAAGEGVDNLDAYLATNPAEPMPRLLLVVDEFAMLAKEYPDVLKSLVSVAAVGRTLGVHMILATQRPAGVVNDDILANTNLRVALRVQSKEDSSSVIGVHSASAIGRAQMGRAFVKLGQDDISPVQTALVTGRAQSANAAVLDAHEVGFGVSGAPAAPAPLVEDKDAPTDLDLIIDAIVEANADLGYAPPRPVWPEPLGERVELAAPDGRPYVAAGAPPAGPLEPGQHPVPVVGGLDGSLISFALSDEPDKQRQIPSGWDVARGNLLLLGIPGSGTTTALRSIALTLCARVAPEDVDLLVLDLGSRELEALTALPHTVGYVGSGTLNRELQVRLLKYVRAELDRRRASPGPHRRLVLLIDGLATLREEFDDFDGLKLLEGLYRAWADGPEVSMWIAATTSRAKAIPPAIGEITTQKWGFRLAEAYDYSAVGVKPKDAPAPVPGRCVLGETLFQTHVATPGAPVDEVISTIAAHWSASAPKQPAVGTLPSEVTVAEIGFGARIDVDPWLIPVGIAEADLGAAVLEVWEGEHVMVVGPPRSGKSTTLLAMTESLRTAALADGTPLEVWGVCGRRSPLAQAGLDRVCVGEDELPAMLAMARVHTGLLVLLVDDAEQFDDGDQALAGLIAAKSPHLKILAAGRSDDLRTSYSHWSKAIRKARCGVLLQPNVDFDGDLLGIGSLPRKSPVEMTPGRGYVAMGGAVGLVQCASPTVDQVAAAG